MKKTIFKFFLFFLPLTSYFSLLPSGLSLEQLIRVRILSKHELKQVQIISPLAQIKTIQRFPNKKEEEKIGPPDLPIQLKAQDRKVQLQIGSYRSLADQVLISPPRGSTLTIELGKELQRKFKGRVQITSVNQSLFFVEELLLDDYVRGVLEAELPQGFPPEAQKAQAIVIRSYALANADRHLKEGYNLCDLTHCQVYAGRNLPYRSLDEVVQVTRRMILVFQGKAIQALFHSTCGGHTSANQKVFSGKALPYLQGVSDEKFCERSPHYRWDNFISLKILEEVLKKDSDTNPKGEIKNIAIAEAEPDQGRVFSVALSGKRNFSLPALELMSVVGRYLGWSQIKSNWFAIEVTEGTAHFVGRGLGHGVGFCQWGAKGMAEAGKKFPEILQHYYPGTQIVER